MNFEIDCKKYLDNPSSNQTSSVKINLKGDKNTITSKFPLIMHDIFQNLDQNIDKQFKRVSEIDRINICKMELTYGVNKIIPSVSLEPVLFNSIKNNKKQRAFLTHLKKEAYSQNQQIFTYSIDQAFEQLISQTTFSDTEKIYLDLFIERYKNKGAIFDQDIMQFFSLQENVRFQKHSKKIIKEKTYFINNNTDVEIVKNLIKQKTHSKSEIKKVNFDNLLLYSFLHDNFLEKDFSNLYHNISSKYPYLEKYTNLSQLNNNDKKRIISSLKQDDLETFANLINSKNHTTNINNQKIKP